MTSHHSLKRHGSLRAIAVTLALATAFGGLCAATAHADEHNDHHRGQDRGQDRGHREHHRPDHPGYAYEHPRGYYVAPPPVYQYQYQPPPPPPAIDFVFPLHLR